MADDNSSNRRILGEMLLSWGLKPTLVGGISECVREMESAKSKGCPFALVLLDSKIAGISTAEFARKIERSPEFCESQIAMLTPAGLRLDSSRVRTSESVRSFPNL